MNTILIVEDEPLAAERLQQLVQGYADRSLQVHWADSVQSACDWLATHTPDLMLCDIQLGDGLSFDIFEKSGTRAPVIFTTAFHEYAIRAFKVNSLDYLLKPVQKDDLYRALSSFFVEKAGANQADQVAEMASMFRKEYKTRFLVKIGEKLISIPVERIAYFFLEERVLLIRTTDGHSYPLNFTLDQIEMMLDPARFFRINRSCCVQIDAIKEVVPFPGNRLEVSLTASHIKTPFIISRELCASFRRWLGE